MLELDLKMVLANEKVPRAVLGEPSHSLSEHILLIATLRSVSLVGGCNVLQISNQSPKPLNGHLLLTTADLPTEPLRVGTGSEGSTSVWCHFPTSSDPCQCSRLCFPGPNRGARKTTVRSSGAEPCCCTVNINPLQD